jgi:hypothetical protein
METMECEDHGKLICLTYSVLALELVNKSPRETRGLLGVSGKAWESQYLEV